LPHCAFAHSELRDLIYLVSFYNHNIGEDGRPWLWGYPRFADLPHPTRLNDLSKDLHTRVQTFFDKMIEAGSLVLSGDEYDKFHTEIVDIKDTFNSNIDSHIIVLKAFNGLTKCFDANIATDNASDFADTKKSLLYRRTSVPLNVFEDERTAIGFLRKKYLKIMWVWVKLKRCIWV
jgi:hypothetical protein